MIVAFGRLLRLSLAATAAADVAAGVVAGAGGWPGARGPFVLMGASLCVYHGGMALNDWADRAEDRRTQPARPIPAGRVAPAVALLTAIVLLSIGPLVAHAVSPQSGRALILVAILAAAYDLRLRGPLLGPFVLALCRGGNLATGLLFGAAASDRSVTWLLLLPAAAYAAYVFAVSRLARLEDAPQATLASSRPAVRLMTAACLLAAAPVAGLSAPGASLVRALAAFGVAAAGSVALLRTARCTPVWTGDDVRRAAGMCLRRLLVFTSAVALVAGGAHGWIVAGAILLGYPLAYALRRVFPPS